MYKIIIDTEAFTDVQNAVDWYDQQRIGLGEEFFFAFDKENQQLRRNPYVFAIKYDYIRCKLIGKFPYNIHYFINEQFQTILVVGVFHTSRNPKLWKKRI